MKKLLIVGAGFLQSFVIQKAVSMGYETIAIDANPNADGFLYAHKHAVIDIVDKEACLEYAKLECIDGVLTAATDYGVLTASYIADQMSLPGLNYEVAKKIKNKYLVRKCLFDNQVDDNEQCYLVSNIDDAVIIKDRLRYPVFVKPCDGSGSRGTSRVDNSSELMCACEIAINNSITHCAVIESFILGSEYGVESIVVNGDIHVLGIMKKWMTNPPYYAELGHSMPSGLSTAILIKAEQCVTKAIQALKINHGSVNMDLLITENGELYIVDIGARMGGNLIGSCVIPYGTGIDYMAAIIRNALGEPVDLTTNKHEAVATRLLAFDEGVIKRMPDMQELEKRYEVEIYHHMREGMCVHEYHTNLDGCGYIVAKAPSVNTAEMKASLVYERIKKDAFEEQYE